MTIPTRFGKSAIFQALPLCASTILEQFSDSSDCSCLLVPCVIVISPLVSLMADQVAKLRSVGITSVLQQSEDTQPQVEAKVTRVFSSPEYLLVGSRWRKLLLENNFVNNILAIVVDEAHRIVKW